MKCYTGILDCAIYTYGISNHICTKKTDVQKFYMAYPLTEHLLCAWYNISWKKLNAKSLI